VVAVFCFSNAMLVIKGNLKKLKKGEATMTNDRFASAHEMVREYAELEAAMADPSIHDDQGKARQLGRRYAQLGPVVAGFKEWKSADEDLTAAKELAATDPDFASEIPALEESAQKAAEKLEELLLPRDPNDDRDVILEVKAGAGGDESALFAGDLLRMYMRYAEKRNWKVEILDATESEMGGYKDISVAVKSKGTAAPGESPYARLKFEGGVHRVQRVPETESQGRIHTSAAGVLILPEAEEIDVELNMNDVRVDVYRSSGPGGQSVNTTDSAVRLTHVPTGIVVSCQNEKSQLQNKESALRILRARLLADAQEKADAVASAERKNQVRTVDRSERIRTYNFPENRLSDHRVNYKSNNLDTVLNGELDDVIQSLLDADKAAKLASTE
jgi:peptide chain release factor 1